jgi:cytochrome P450
MPLAVNEVVRFVSPVLNFSRTVTQDTEVGGQKIREGERVLMVYPAANRDPEVFAEPDRFDVGRDPNPHVGFGIGPHFCLGANLARMELTVVFEELLARYSRLEFVKDGVTIVPHDLVRTHVDMPVRVTPL